MISNNDWTKTHLGDLARRCYLALLLCLLSFQSSYAENTTENIERIIIYATDPSKKMPIDDSRITFFDSWEFDGMHFKSISEPDSINEFKKMIDKLEPLDTLSYGTYSNGTIIKKTRKGKSVFLPPARPGPIGAVIIMYSGGKKPELMWITSSSLDRGFVAYKVPPKLLRILDEIINVPNKYIYIFKDIFHLPVYISG